MADYTESFFQDIQRMRAMISMIMCKAESHFSGKVIPEKEMKELWDQKENLTAILYRLAPLYLKLDPRDFELRDKEKESAGEQPALTPAQWKILEEYVRRRDVD